MNITSIQRFSPPLQARDSAIKAVKLSSSLPFLRKPVDLDEVGDTSRQDGESMPVYVLETKEPSTAEFDTFASSLLDSRDWLNTRNRDLGTNRSRP